MFCCLVGLRVSDISKDYNVIIIIIRVSPCGLLESAEKAL
jgi:hypothetical protein